jgi:hypothetical protein
MIGDAGARSYYIKQLNLQPNGKDQRTACCPFHEDSSASLSVNLATGLWTCHAACGSGNRATFAAQLNGRAPKAAPVAAAASANFKVGLRRMPTATHLYANAAGEVLFRKQKFVQPDGKKTFLLNAANPAGGWDTDLSRLTGAGVPMPLYNLPAALAPEVTTIVKTEGEKDADNLKAHLPKTHAAVTNYEGGSVNKWCPEYEAVVRDKHVIVCEDNDDIGRAHAAFWADACLLAGALSVKVDSYRDDLEEKCDVSDYLDANPDADLLRRWAVLGAWSSPEQQRFLTAPEFLARLPERVEWIWQGRIPKASSVLFTGQNKIGKSTLVNCLILARSLGKEFLDQPTVKGRTLLLTEMSGADLRAEFAACPGLGENADVSILTQNDCYDWNWEETLRQAYLRCVTTGVDLLVIDTFNSWTLLENQNDAAQTLQAYHSLRQFLQAGIAVFIEDHEGIDGGRDIGNARRGSTALAGQVSVVLSLRHLTGSHGPDTRLRQLVRSGRHGVSAETIEWAEGEYTFLGYSAAVSRERAGSQLRTKLPRSAKDAWTLEEIVNKLGIARTTAQSQLKTLVATKVVSVVRHEGKKSSKKNPKRFWLDATPPAPTITVSVGPKKLKF